MANIKYLIKSKVKNRPAPVFIRVYYSKDYDVFANTRQSVLPGHWDSKREKVKNIADATDKDAVNRQLEQLRTYIKNEVANVGKVEKDWLLQTIENYYTGPKEPEKVTLFKFVREFINQAPRRINPKTDEPVCYKQQREYERTFYYLQEYSNHIKKELDFEDITLDFYHDFVEYLQSTKTVTRKDGKKIDEPGLSKNTIGKKIQTLKIFLNAATDEGLNSNTQYKSQRFKAVKEDSDSIYLDVDELNSMANLDLSDNKRLETVRDLFLVGCWTGLRFSDWDKVTERNIKNGKLEIKQSKTGNPVIIPLHPVLRFMLNKYKNDLPPVISNQKFNDYLKDVAKKAGIVGKEQKTMTKAGVNRTTTFEKWQMVSTHTARRSFATNLYYRRVPSITIMAITGHKTESSFLKYIKVTPDQHAKILDDVWKNDSLTFTMRIA